MRNYDIALPISSRLVRYMTADQKFPTLLPLYCLIVCCFSPVVAYWLSLALLVVLSSFIHKIDRQLFSFVVVLSGSAIWASRAFDAIEWDDFVRYYQTYTHLYGGDWSHLYTYGHGIEIGLPIIYLIFSWTLPKLTPNGLMFFQSVLSGLLFLWVLEKYLLKGFDQERYGAVSALCLLYYSFFLSTQLCRQFLAMLVILPVLFDKRIKITLILAGISFFVHTSSLFIIFIYRALLSIKLWVTVILIPVACLLFYCNQNYLSDNLLFLSDTFIGKGQYYSTVADKYTQNLAAVKLLIVPVLSLLTAWLWLLISQKGQMISREEKAHQRRWIIFYFSVFLLYMTLIDFKELPYRFFLMVHGIMIGWFVALFLKRLPYSMFFMTLCVILVQSFSGFVVRQDWGSMSAPGVAYPLINIFPGYFFLSYFV